MNSSQRVVLAASALALAGVLLFPPWLAVSEWADGHADRDECGRHFLVIPPQAPTALPELRARVEGKRRAGALLYSGPDSYVIDWSRQIIPISVTVAVGLSGLVLLRRRGQAAVT